MHPDARFALLSLVAAGTVLGGYLLSWATPYLGSALLAGLSLASLFLLALGAIVCASGDLRP